MRQHHLVAKNSDTDPLSDLLHRTTNPIYRVTLIWGLGSPNQMRNKLVKKDVVRVTSPLQGTVFIAWSLNVVCIDICQLLQILDLGKLMGGISRFIETFLQLGKCGRWCFLRHCFLQFPTDLAPRHLPQASSKNTSTL